MARQKVRKDTQEKARGQESHMVRHGQGIYPKEGRVETKDTKEKEKAQGNVIDVEYGGTTPEMVCVRGTGGTGPKMVEKGKEDFET